MWSFWKFFKFLKVSFKVLLNMVTNKVSKTFLMTHFFESFSQFWGKLCILCPLCFLRGFYVCRVWPTSAEFSHAWRGRMTFKIYGAREWNSAPENSALSPVRYAVLKFWGVQSFSKTAPLKTLKPRINTLLCEKCELKFKRKNQTILDSWKPKNQYSLESFGELMIPN